VANGPTTVAESRSVEPWWTGLPWRPWGVEVAHIAPSMAGDTVGMDLQGDVEEMTGTGCGCGITTATLSASSVYSASSTLLSRDAILEVLSVSLARISMSMALKTSPMDMAQGLWWQR
jgi:hypothetical protein